MTYHCYSSVKYRYTFTHLLHITTALLPVDLISSNNTPPPVRTIPNVSHPSPPPRIRKVATMADVFDINAARKAFPALQQPHQVYFDNAGGSQVLSTVASSYDSRLLRLPTCQLPSTRSSPAYLAASAPKRYADTSRGDVERGPTSKKRMSNWGPRTTSRSNRPKATMRVSKQLRVSWALRSMR